MSTPCVALVCAVFLLSSAGLSTGFVLETIDENNAGANNQLALDSAGRPHVCYKYTYPTHPPRTELRYARKAGTWEIEVLLHVESPSFSGVQDPAIAIDSSDRPHVAYIAQTPSGDGLGLVHGYKNESGWHWETVDPNPMANGDASMAVGDEGDIHIAYRDSDIDDLKYAHGVDGIWTIETVDAPGSVGGYASLDLQPNGDPAIAYYNYDAYEIKYASSVDGVWSTEVAVSDINLFGCSSLEIDGDGVPHLSYTTTTTSKLAYAVKTGSTWVVEVVTAAEGVKGEETALELDSNGNPHIVYYDQTRKDLLYVVKEGLAWSVSLIADEQEAGFHHDFALDGLDSAHITLTQSGPSDGTDLLYAFRASADAPELALAAWDETRLTVAPNPSFGSTGLRFELSQSSTVRIAIFDPSGHLVRDLAQRELRSSGMHEVLWDGTDPQGRRVSPGVYFVRMETGRTVSTRPLVVID